MFAIVQVAGKQYTVKKGASIVVDRMEGAVGDALKLKEVLLVSDEGKTTIGTPYVEGAMVKAKIVSQEKGEKIEVRKFKSKVRYRKHIGFRPQVTKLEITAIE